MMQDSEDILLTPEEERVRNAVQALPPPAAHPAFRNRLRREFATGKFEPRSRPVIPRATAWFTWRWAAAATAILLVIGFAFVNQGPDWRVMTVEGTGNVIVNGTTLALSDQRGMERALRRGGRVSVPEGSQLTLLSPKTVLVQVAPQSEVTLPVPSGRWFRRTMKASVTRGEARLMTGADFHGRVMTIDTPAGTTILTGTLVSVVTDGTFTCVCVAEGTAQAGKSPTSMEFVPRDMRKVMFADKRPSVMLPIEAEHATGLATLLREHAKDIAR
ncbi:MAG TPA: FecR domain-containing protein [Candidatus Eisenbacteria bacterium]|nr:FecR domain-containing protein [Candidatus Eisenbacteria bacterium]